MTKEGPLLQKLGALAKEQREAQLPPELEAPLGEDFARQVLLRVSRPKETAAPSRGPGERKAMRPGRRAGRRVLLLPVLAACAAVLLVVVSREPSSSSLPNYVLEVSGGQAFERSGEGTQESPTAPAAGLLVVDGNTILELVLRPDAPVTEDVGAQAFLVREGQTTQLDVVAERSEDGAFRFTLPAKGLLTPAGPAELVLWVGSPAERARAGGDEIPMQGQRFSRTVHQR